MVESIRYGSILPWMYHTWPDDILLVAQDATMFAEFSGAMRGQTIGPLNPNPRAYIEAHGSFPKNQQVNAPLKNFATAFSTELRHGKRGVNNFEYYKITK